MAAEQGAPKAVVATLSVILGVVVGVVGTYAVMSAWNLTPHTGAEPSMPDDVVACTQIGAQGGINIALPTKEITPGSKARLTVDDGSGTLLSAEITTAANDSGQDYLFLPVDYGYEVDLAVTLSYTNAQGQETTLTAKGQPVLVEPNGPECPPHVYQLNLDVKDGALLPSTEE